MFQDKVAEIKKLYELLSEIPEGCLLRADSTYGRDGDLEIALMPVTLPDGEDVDGCCSVVNITKAGEIIFNEMVDEPQTISPTDFLKTKDFSL